MSFVVESSFRALREISIIKQSRKW